MWNKDNNVNYVDLTPVQFLSRMYTALAENHGMGADTFKDPDAARAWLLQPHSAP